ncbi:5,10-methylenetetrahydromethanopterin reductase [Phenylobacterium zucineum HLK1]|uniref:5,10-methylenetetrahydromethanopterin reductase n=1 Tax=Phenylobacterium zucineum (strain HLK1) TaxID=450851 RepID=B4RH04_PHEZH|nr:LLM class F420-dependent oxidoreductase [Phenylobacterium zucineum]ACG78952.1 5,10-methylenetetrahydromethanopterin reductase [Phenylobacterium zucineum HLK1]
MKLGLAIGYGDKPNYTPPVERVQLAERLGFHSVWTAETYGADAMTPLAYLAAHTKRIKLGTGIAQLDARTPANLAMCAQTIDALAGGGRMIVGIGASGPQIVEGWYGRPWGKPNPRLRDTAAILKKIFRREGPVSHEGKEISLPYQGEGGIGLGKPLKGILHSGDIPVYLGTDTPLNVRMTAEVADGWLAMHFVPGDLKRYRPLLEEGFARRTDGMTLDRFEIRGAIANVVIADDVKAALQPLKAHVALFVGGMGAKEKNFHKETMVNRGYGEAAERIQELFLAGRKEEAAAAVPDDYLDEESLVGPPERIRERWAAWRDSGLTGITFRKMTDEAIELIAKIARE